MRELVWMAEAKSRDAWRHTSAMMALVANANRDPRGQRPFRPADFDPHEQEPKTVLRGKGLRLLKDVFVKPKPARGPTNR